MCVSKGGPLFILGLALKFGFGFFNKKLTITSVTRFQKSKPYFCICYSIKCHYILIFQFTTSLMYENESLFLLLSSKSLFHQVKRKEYHTNILVSSHVRTFHSNCIGISKTSKCNYCSVGGF